MIFFLILTVTLFSYFYSIIMWIIFNKYFVLNWPIKILIFMSTICFSSTLFLILTSPYIGLTSK